MTSNPGFSRRDFLATSTKTLATVGFGSLFAARTAAAAGRMKGANDRIIIGLIGAGGRGTSDASASIDAGNVVCAALCDVADFRYEHITPILSKKMQNKGHANIKIERDDDYRRLLDRKDIDGVIIATPDHWHRRPFIDALDAGKHIYQEKPMCHTIEQGLEMVEAAKKHPQLIVQIGTQRRSCTYYHKVKALIDEGKIGEIMFARAYDCRNWVLSGDPFAPKKVSGKIDWDKFQEPCAHKVEYDPWRYFAWRWYWDYAGGLVTDVGVHVMDIVHWLTGNTVPKSVVCNGGVYGLKRWETPDVVNAVWDYGTHSVAFTSNFTNKYMGDGLTLYGTQGTIEIGRENADVLIWSEGEKREQLYKLSYEGVEHRRNWIDSIRSGKQPNAPVELGFSSLLPSLLANLAYRQGKKVNWDQVNNKVV